MLKVNNKDTKRTSMISFWWRWYKFWWYFTPFSFSIVDFVHVSFYCEVNQKDNRAKLMKEMLLCFYHFPWIYLNCFFFADFEQANNACITNQFRIDAPFISMLSQGTKWVNVWPARKFLFLLYYSLCIAQYVFASDATTVYSRTCNVWISKSFCDGRNTGMHLRRLLSHHQSFSYHVIDLI